jgi:hypothetical protein
MHLARMPRFHMLIMFLARTDVRDFPVIMVTLRQTQHWPYCLVSWLRVALKIRSMAVALRVNARFPIQSKKQRTPSMIVVTIPQRTPPSECAIDVSILHHSFHASNVSLISVLSSQKCNTHCPLDSTSQNRLIALPLLPRFTQPRISSGWEIC